MKVAGLDANPVPRRLLQGLRGRDPGDVDGVGRGIQSAFDYHLLSDESLGGFFVVEEVSLQLSMRTLAGDEGDASVLELHDCAVESIGCLLGLSVVIRRRMPHLLRMQCGWELTESNGEQEGCQPGEQSVCFDFQHV